MVLPFGALRSGRPTGAGNEETETGEMIDSTQQWFFASQGFFLPQKFVV